MFEKEYEERLASWRNFRDKLESSQTPFQDVLSFYKQARLASIHTDPWDQKTWPSPWELLFENRYCEFCTVLGMCYSLQLTERFKDSFFEIHISKDNSSSEIYYLLCIDDVVINYDDNSVILKNDLPDSMYSQRIYTMTKLH